ncbi:SCO2522 family protein [Nocardia sp. NBC_01377]|uniref:SCO2522 family protein n=1 Tax=Nocardia sp. NBC_01377 TaxID=2903595 RepID=UPI0032525B8A
MPDTSGVVDPSDHSSADRIPMSHLSIEVGHFSLADVRGNMASVRADLRRIAPLMRAFTESARVRYGPAARISTCYLIDDYFEPDIAPVDILDDLRSAAAEIGSTIDYFARLSSCARATRFAHSVPTGDPIPVAEMVAARIVTEPSPPDAGRRPPTGQSGWLCNSKRATEHEAAQDEYRTPTDEYGRHEHSLFLDVQLWSNRNTAEGTETRWSCAFLTTVWHLLRLGLLRYDGAPVTDPQPWYTEPTPPTWDELPPVVQINPDATPFPAYRTLSILPKQYVGIEHAVRLVLDHLSPYGHVNDEIIAGALAEPVPMNVPRSIGDRLSHLLLDGS